jgi:hypothetical protein
VRAGRLATGALAAAALAAGRVAAQERAGSPRWELLIGHSYSSARALTQPATLVLEKSRGAPWYTVLDAGALVRGSLAARSWLEAGARTLAGSARTPRQRVFAAMARAYRELDPVLVAVGSEYEADGGFDLQRVAATAEVTPLGGLPGLGTWVSPGLRLRWRPWIGATVGAGVRPYARLAAEYATGRVEAGLESTGWLVDGSGVGYVRGDLSVALAAGFSLTASGEAGRQPPRFAPAGRLGVGLGFRFRTGT